MGEADPMCFEELGAIDGRIMLQQRVNDEMNGTMCMEVFPNSTLYTDEQVIEAMLRGDVQLAAPSLSLFESITKAFRLFDLPFMFKNIEAVDAFQASETGSFDDITNVVHGFERGTAAAF